MQFTKMGMFGIEQFRNIFNNKRVAMELPEQDRDMFRAWFTANKERIIKSNIATNK